MSRVYFILFYFYSFFSKSRKRLTVLDIVRQTVPHSRPYDLKPLSPNRLAFKSLGFGRTRRDFVTDLKVRVGMYVGMSSDKWREGYPFGDRYTVEHLLLNAIGEEPYHRPYLTILAIWACEGRKIQKESSRLWIRHLQSVAVMSLSAIKYRGPYQPHTQ